MISQNEYIGVRINKDLRAWLDDTARRRGLSLTTIIKLALQALRREWDMEDAEYRRQVKGEAVGAGER